MVVAMIRTSKGEKIFFNVRKMTLNCDDDSAKNVICVLQMGYGYKFKALISNMDNRDNCYILESEGKITEIN